MDATFTNKKRGSLSDTELPAAQIEQLCGRGSLLDVGCGTGLPFPSESFDTVTSINRLEHIPEAEVPAALRELHRVTRRFVFIRLASKLARAWWESQFFAAGFRKHALAQKLVSYEALEHEGPDIAFLFEKIPAAVLAEYPLEALKAERDLHMDMFREPGRRSDAHIARYMLACDYLPKAGGVVIDAACGLGYGSAMLAHCAGTAKVVGMDESEFAARYAERNFCPNLPNLSFQRGDACNLSAFADGSVDLVVSFETVEHLREPAVFLKEIKRALKPGGKFICSAPNLWVDEHGKDPNPWHFHVFDFAKVAGLCGEYFDLLEVFSQTAGGGMKLPDAPRQLRKLNLPVTSGGDEAEWWLVAAEKEAGADAELLRRAGNGKVVVMTTHPGHSIYRSWISCCPFPVTNLDPSGPDAAIPDDTLLLVTHDTYTEPGRSLIRKAVAAGVPTLILADGILDYRNTWEHPQLEAGVIFQPVLGHKIATIGRSQSRWLESWGNGGKCETVGLPRLDKHCGFHRRQHRTDEPFRILINTAITPYFTESHRQKVTASLRDLKAFFDNSSTHNGVRLEPVWRLTKGLDAELGVLSKVSDLSGHEMAVTLKEVDAVITTPSTVILEAGLFGLPVATLDYCNTPHYIATAWRITAREQIAETVRELINPPEPKLLFQETSLHDSLECATPAAPRMMRLVAEMVEHGFRARAAGKPLSFPHSILAPQISAPVENRFRMDRLYPGETAVKAVVTSAAQTSRTITKDDEAKISSDPVKLRALAAAASQEGRYAEAVGGYSRLLELNASDTGALMGKAVCCAMRGHLVMAEILLKDLLKIEPDNVPARDWLATVAARKTGAGKPNAKGFEPSWQPIGSAGREILSHTR